MTADEATATPPILTRRLCKCYEDGLDALVDLDLKVERGEIYCLLGANGAGKTTALNLLMSFVQPTSGLAMINGVDVAADPLAARQHAAYLAERVMLFETMSVRQNLEFFGELCGEQRLDDDQANALLELVGLSADAIDRKVRDLSKGMRQKLGLAICIAKGSAALILDEPMSGLDPEACQQMMEMLEQLRKRGRAILMSTHDVFRARELASRVGVLKAGRLIREIEQEQLEHVDLAGLYLDLMKADGEPSQSSMLQSGPVDGEKEGAA